MASPLEALENSLTEYAALRKRLGEDDYRFSDALIGQRRQCLTNLLDDEDPSLVERVKLLDALASARGIPLHNEPALRYALDEIAERDRKRRAQRIAEHRRGAA